MYVYVHKVGINMMITFMYSLSECIVLYKYIQPASYLVAITSIYHHYVFQASEQSLLRFYSFE